MIKGFGLFYMYMHIRLYFFPFSFGHCIVYPSIYGFLLSLWLLQTFLTHLVDKVTRRNGDLAQVQLGGLELEDPETFRLKILVAICVV